MNSQIVDLIGVKAITLLIQQANLTKFIIQKYGSPKGTLPVFESLDNKTVDKAVTSFSHWANIVLMGNPNNETIYEINLFNEENFDPDNDEEITTPKLKVGKSKKDKIKFNFMLCSLGERVNGSSRESSGTSSPGSLNIDQVKDIISQSIKTHLEREEREELMDRIGTLEETLLQIAEQKAEVPETDPIDRISKIIDKIGLMNMQKGNNTAVVNGDPGTRKEMLLNAINELQKVDPNLPEHLDKLKTIAVTDPAQFKQFLKILETL